MMIEKLPVMGYAIAAEVEVDVGDFKLSGGVEASGPGISAGSGLSPSGARPFRYTEWVGYDFKHYVANFSDLRAVELYNLSSDPEESENIAVTQANSSAVVQLKAAMHKALLAGWRAALPKNSPLPVVIPPTKVLVAPGEVGLLL
jgi:hypothetical protein